MKPALPSSPRLQAVAAFAVMTLCLAVILWAFWPIRGLLAEIFALVLLVLGFRYCPPTARGVGRMPAVHRTIFFLLFAAVVLGHFTLNTRRFFPFVPWDIFSAVSEKSPVPCRELIGTTAAGRPVRLLVEQLFPSIVQFDLPPADQPGQMLGLVHSLALAYNRRHAADPLRRVDLVLVAVELQPPPHQPPGPSSCQLLRRYDISSAR